MDDKVIMENLMEKVGKALEEAIYQKAGNFISYPHGSSIDTTNLCKEAYKRIDLEKVINQIAEKLENIMAEKLVASLTTEFGNDIKKMMTNAVIRKDLQDWLQIQTADLLKRVGDKEGAK
jgi:hypothetical protein